METRSRSFYRNSEKALADPVLQAALSRATAKFVEARAESVAAFPGFEAAREQGARIKADALENLDRHLARFIAEAERRGAVIHVARDAAAARDMAARIAMEEGVSLAVKSKSMAAEEVGLTTALEAAGVEVVESDLGEFIVQLACESPSHIIAPAVHKTREQVSRLFREKLGADCAGNIPELVRIACAHMRRKFLAAGMGVTGANFLCADTGSVVLVTNEGNGRMGTILPRVHLVVAGIEKVIPRLADLPVFLRILPRSATGQIISTYVSVLTGSRRERDPEGPEKLHIILVDNGRTGILQGKYREILKCIRCGACLNICPVYRSVGGHAYGGVYAGPVGSVLTPLLDGLYEGAPLPNASTLCGACREVCPVKIPLPELLLELRGDERDQGLKTPDEILAIKGFAAVMSRAGILEALERIIGVVSQLFHKEGKGAWLPLGFSAWTERRDFPAPAEQPFRKLWKKQRGIRPWTRPLPPSADSAAPDHPRPAAGRKEELIRRVAGALRGPEGVITAPTPVRAHAESLDQTVRTALFRERFEEQGGSLLEGAALEPLLPVLGEELRLAGITAILFPEEDAGARLVAETLAPFGPFSIVSSSEARQPSAPGTAGVQTAENAVVETGSIVQTSRGGKTLLPGLITDVHVALLAPSLFVDRLDDILAPPPDDPPRNISFITGPSRTGDIEQTLTIGAHGPKKMIAVLLTSPYP